MPTIRQLPQSVINKIAAGEVIERPASVVKELMENSVDAGATRVDVAVEQGGLELIRVSDDGCGIGGDDLPLAVASHATSKIAGADDLFRVRTLGFRGEALASIAEVSQFVIRSRPRTGDAGMELSVAGGHAAAPAPCGAPAGTTIEVRQLFYNTPVRRKFLRSTQTEMGHASEAFTRLALAYPDVHFTLSHNGRSVYDLPPVGDVAERIGAFFGHDLAADLIAVESREGEVRLAGYVASPSHSRSHARLQYLFLNGRAIRDRALGHALAEAYRGLLLTGRHPVAFLRIEMPPEMVDVNVHPTKLEVRFQESGKLYGQLLGTLRTKFLATDLTARLQPLDSEAASAVDPRLAGQLRRELVDWAKGEMNALDAGGDVSQGAAVQSRFDEAWRAARPPLELSTLARRWDAPGRGAAERLKGAEAIDESAPADEAALHGGPHAPEPQARHDTHGEGHLPGALQLHNRYLVTESEDGIVVIDQHALHERIIYEHLREKVLSGALESQALLVPEPVDLSPAEAAAALEAREVLAELGVAIEPFGGATVLVSSFPAMLANFRPAEVLRDLVERLLADGKPPERRDLVDSLLHMISCKAAIKAGDRLSAGEIDALLAQRHLARDTHHCPHGRPTALFFSREELDRQFKRI